MENNWDGRLSEKHMEELTQDLDYYKDKCKHLQKEVERLQKGVFQPLECCDKPMEFSFSTETTPEIYSCKVCGHKIVRNV